MSNDRSYFAQRAVEERKLAMSATDANARRVHLELAAQYTMRAGGTDFPLDEGSEQAGD